MGASNPQSESKQRAAQAAIALMPESGVIGLGSGSTATLFVRELAQLVKAGRDLRGVPTSEATRALAASLGIPLVPDAEATQVDVCVDGADEITEDLSAIKGGGGAHTREKIVNRAAALNVIVVDESKLVARLGERWAVPVEVLAFAHQATARHLRALGDATLRTLHGAPVRTDSGNLIYDVRTGVIAQPGALDEALRRIPGVVETGLFVGKIDIALIAGVDGVRRIER